MQEPLRLFPQLGATAGRMVGSPAEEAEALARKESLPEARSQPPWLQVVLPLRMLWRALPRQQEPPLLLAMWPVPLP